VTPLVGAWLAIAAAAAVVDWVVIGLDRPGTPAIERVAKPAALLALLGAALAWPAGAGDAAVRSLLLVALAASLAGDLLLLGSGRFVAGLVAFLIAHLAYVVAFTRLPGSVPWVVAGAIVAAVVVATVGRVLVRAARRMGLAAPVGAYLVVICTMAIAATRTGLPAAIVGAWLFVASDAMLAWGRFGTPASGGSKGPTRLRVAVMVTYHLGQALLVLALVA
jgi:uncharacterized membrane protein YhhN